MFSPTFSIVSYYYYSNNIVKKLLVCLNCFMNDFSKSSQLLFSILFADDTTVLLEGKEYEGLIMALNNELHKVSTWLDANKLSINTKKTHFMVFHRSRIKTNDVMQQNIIERVNSTKFLGLIIDDKN